MRFTGPHDVKTFSFFSKHEKGWPPKKPDIGETAPVATFHFKFLPSEFSEIATQSAPKIREKGLAEFVDLCYFWKTNRASAVQK